MAASLLSPFAIRHTLPSTDVFFLKESMDMYGNPFLPIVKVLDARVETEVISGWPEGQTYSRSLSNGDTSKQVPCTAILVSASELTEDTDGSMSSLKTICTIGSRKSDCRCTNQLEGPTSGFSVEECHASNTSFE